MRPNYIVRYGENILICALLTNCKIHANAHQVTIY